MAGNSIFANKLILAVITASVATATLTYGGVKYYEKYVADNTSPTVTQIQGYQYGRNGRGFGHGHDQAQVGHGGPQNNQHECDEVLADLPKGDISEQEKQDIYHMREEEKLARDVYLTLYQKWGIQTFQNIANSEQRHMDSMKVLIDRYGLDDPMKSDDVGAFSDLKLKELYKQLVELGSKSEIDALKVGATIEDLDIYDLNEALKRTDNEDIRVIYENLRQGSYNHIRAFVSQLQSRGSDYTPQYISIEEYKDIIGSISRGNRGRENSGKRISQFQGRGGQGRGRFLE